MSRSAVVKHEENIDLSTLAPDVGHLSNHLDVPWHSITAAQAGCIYMRPLLTLTSTREVHWNCLVMLRGLPILLDTWEGETSRHTAISMAFHTGCKSLDLHYKRVQLPDQGGTSECWSRIFVYMAQLARQLTIDSDINHVLQILSATQVAN